MLVDHSLVIITTTVSSPVLESRDREDGVCACLACGGKGREVNFSLDTASLVHDAERPFPARAIARTASLVDLFVVGEWREVHENKNTIGELETRFVSDVGTTWSRHDRRFLGLEGKEITDDMRLTIRKADPCRVQAIFLPFVSC